MMLELQILAALVPGQDSRSAEDFDARWARYREGQALERAYREAAALSVQWAPDGRSLNLARQGRASWEDVLTGQPVSAPTGDARTTAPQLTSVGGRAITSPNGEWRLSVANRNVQLTKIATSENKDLTSDGSSSSRIENGTVPWVYGEELAQRIGMAWSPRGTHFWFYKFNGSDVRDYYLSGDQLKIQSSLQRLDYPKAGTPNHKVEIWVGEADGSNLRKIESVPTPDREYVWDIRWLTDDTLVYQRSNRLQNIREWVRWTPSAGTVVLHTEEAKGGFLPYQWRPRVEGDWGYIATNREGFANWIRVNVKTGRTESITDHAFDVDFAGILHIGPNAMIYRARGGQHWLANQLYRVDLRSRRSVRLTDETMHHAVSVSPNGEFFVTAPQMPGVAPEPNLIQITPSGPKPIRKFGVPSVPMLPGQAVEHFTFKAGDTRTDLAGNLWFPRGFDPSKRYPVIFDVYAGPESTDVSLGFRPYRAMTEMGYLIVQVETRGGLGRGSVFRDSVYRKLGIVEIDDIAAAAKALSDRPYVDSARIGIYGTSYGGYASLMAILRYPDVFAAASASASPTDWRNYDTIYTERYMGLPSEAKEDYDRGNPMTYVKNLRGALQLYHGTADDNVHVSNTLQMVRALDDADKSYELRIGPDRGHTFVGDRPMLRFFEKALRP